MNRALVSVTVAAVTLSSAGCSSPSPSTSSGTNAARPPASVTAPPIVEATAAPASTDQPSPDRSRSLLIGDSTLLAVLRYNAFVAFGDLDFVYDAKSCRTIGVPSCGDRPVPTNSVEAIRDAEGIYDVVVIMAGYDEWWTSFPSSFDEVVEASRDKGSEHIVWLTYREGVGYTAPDGSTANEAFVKNNQTLRAKVALPGFGDVILADWYGYTASTNGWLSDDGIHLTRTGALAVADYIARMIASIDGTACPAPREPGGQIEDPCPSPDDRPPVADVRALYP